MFNLICALIFVTLGLIGINIHEPDNWNFAIVGVVLLCIALLWTITAVINSLSEHSIHIAAFEKLKGEVENFLNYKKVKLELSTMLTSFLGDKYPEFEKTVIANVGENHKVALLLQYPELATSDVFINLTTKLSDAINSEYNKRRELITEVASIKAALLSKWVFFKPAFPKELTVLLREI